MKGIEMKRLFLVAGLTTLLSGCFYTPYYWEGGIHVGGGHEGGGWHEGGGED
jgi:hypothetical protein